MTQNANAIITLCSHLCVGDDVIPLEPAEWGALAKRLVDLRLQPEDLFGFSRRDLTERVGLTGDLAERILRLFARNASLTFELEKLENFGITAVTRADRDYPAALKKKLGAHCPPLFYSAGDLSLLNAPLIGYVGSRTVTDQDVEFTRQTVLKTAAKGYGVVSGGAKGIDSASEEAALDAGVPAVDYLSDSMLRKLRSARITKAIRDKRLLLLSVSKPDAGFNVGFAMMRNRYIYAQSVATVIVRSDYQKGGTWAGAVENLKYEWCKTICRDHKAYKGNQELIRLGAIGVGENWDGDPDSLLPSPKTGEQIGFFDGE